MRSPIVDLNRAVAVGMAEGPEAALAIVDRLTREPALKAYPLLPSVQVNAQTYNRGVAGTPQASSGGPANPYFVGGYGSALGQIFRRNFPNYSSGVSFSAPLGNRQAQGDYGIDQLSLRQQQLISAKDMNQAQVDVTNSVVALRQARARYEAAVQSTKLQQALLDAEEKKFSFGASTPYDVVVQQRDLATARASRCTQSGHS